MYNPFPLFTQILLTAKIMEGKRYFVRQSYLRGMQPLLKAAFLLRAYEAGEKEMAEEHVKHLINDKHAFLYDITDQAHLIKLQTAATQPEGYKIYYAGKKNAKWKPPAEYEQSIKRYLQKNYPDWRTRKGVSRIEIGLHEQFGQLFLKFSFGKEEAKVLFDEIEKY